DSLRKPVRQPPSKPPQRHLTPPRPSGPDPAAPASSRHQPQPIRRLCCCLEPPKTAGKRSSFGRFSNLSFSLIRPPNQSCEAPGVRPNCRRDLRRVQLARTSSRRSTNETTRAIFPAFAPPPKCRISLEISFSSGKKVICARHSPGVGHAQDSARIPKRKLGRLIMGPKRGGFRRGTRQSSRVRGQNPPPEPEDLPTPEPVQELVEQSFVGGPSGPAPPMPTMMGDPNLQQTLELLTQALSRTGQSRDLSLDMLTKQRE
ncbi:hypothetical protein Prudu_009961, partial [Prunus dulcis]